MKKLQFCHESRRKDCSFTIHSIISSIFMLFFYTRDIHGCLGHVTMFWRFVSAWILNSFASSSNRDRITKQTNSRDFTIIPGATRTTGLPSHPEQLTGDGSPRKTGRGRGGGTTVACQSRDGQTKTKLVLPVNPELHVLLWWKVTENCN